jgi:uncharacterized membrane protein HdeD (DUF308 family)
MITAEHFTPGRAGSLEGRMIQTLIQNWWLLALCGVLDAMYAVMNLLMFDPEGSLTLRRWMGPGTVRNLGEIALAAGACTIAAGIWSSGKGKSWLLALNGFALGVFGLICLSPIPRGRVSFLPFALLFVVMAASIGVFALATARTLRRHVADRWCLDVAGTAAIGFALGFLVLGFRWMRLEPTEFLLWMSSWFAFSALSMMGVALRLNSLRLGIHRIAGALPIG